MSKSMGRYLILFILVSCAAPQTGRWTHQYATEQDLYQAKYICEIENPLPKQSYTSYNAANYYQGYYHNPMGPQQRASNALIHGMNQGIESARRERAVEESNYLFNLCMKAKGFKWQWDE